MLPQATRQPMDLALLMPGTSQDAVRARKANSNIGAGAFTNGSALLVDGVWNKEGNTGEPRQDFPAVGNPGVQGVPEPVAGRIRLDGRRRRVDGHQERHQPVPRRSVRVLSQQGAQRDRSVRESGGPAEAGLQPSSVWRRDRRARSSRTSVHFFEAAEALQNNLYDNVVVRLPQFYGNMNGVFASPEYNHMSFTRGDVQISQKQIAVRALRVAGLRLHV